MLGRMEPNAAAEELPALYRAVLDRVGELAIDGQRTMANRVRADAIAIYSRAWDERARRDLEALLRRHTPEVVGPRVVGRGFRRRKLRPA
jgi:hypothetical protein